MYAVVGCSDCQALWIVEGRPETSQCPRCGTTRPHAKRRTFVSTTEKDRALEVRSELLAAQQGMEAEFADLDTVAEMAERASEAGVDDDAYLAASGLDPEEIAAAGERSGASGTGGGRSRKEVVRAAVRTVDEPTEEAIVAHAEERGVPADYARRALAKLVRTGEATESRGRYRLL